MCSPATKGELAGHATVPSRQILDSKSREERGHQCGPLSLTSPLLAASLWAMTELAEPPTMIVSYVVATDDFRKVRLADVGHPQE
jgi:hypothetical protein